MHPIDVLKYGHRTVMNTLEGLPESEWNTPGVTGVWSVKDIVAHLASHEQVFEEILCSFLGNDPTPTLDMFKAGPLQFNDPEVEKRKHLTPKEVLTEYEQTQRRNMDLIAQIPEEKLRETGTLPWYGLEYNLEDFITYGVYGHKREHSAQINVFRDTLKNKVKE